MYIFSTEYHCIIISGNWHQLIWARPLLKQVNVALARITIMSSSGPGAVSIRILFFAKSRELSGLSETTHALEAANIKALDLLELICSSYNLQAVRNNIILAINEVYCDDLSLELELKEGDEVALIPPISGG